MEQRIKVFDEIKGTVMLLVILVHGSVFIGVYGPASNPLWFVLGKTSSVFYMVFMFCVSGYFFSSQKKKLKSLKEDIIQLYVPFILLNYILFFERLIGKGVWGITGETVSELSVCGVFQKLYMYDTVTWFLFSMLVTRSVVRFLHDSFNDYIFLLITMLIVVVFYLFFPTFLPYVEYMPAYWVGHLIRADKIPLNKFVAMAGGIIWIGLCLVSCLWGSNVFIENICGVAGFLFLLRHPYLIPKGKFIEICGEDSMVLYFVHGMSQFVILSLAMKYVQNSIVVFIVYVVATFIMFFGIRCMYMKVNCLSWIEYIFYPKKLFKNKV